MPPSKFPAAPVPSGSVNSADEDPWPEDEGTMPPSKFAAAPAASGSDDKEMEDLFGPDDLDAAPTAAAGADVPLFSPEACGTPLDWNQATDLYYWGNKTKRWYPAVKGANADIGKMLHFLSVRPGPDGQPVSNRIGEPVLMDQGWFRCPWLDFNEASTPVETVGSWADVPGKADWQRAWHGCKVESLYSIMYHGKLFASKDAERGDRFSEKAPGVYVHKDGSGAKAGNYVRWVPLFSDGIFWAVKWELRVDRSDRVPPGPGTDQWVQEERSVRLAALWICGRKYEDQMDGEEISGWKPQKEANPINVFSQSPPAAIAATAT